MHLLYMYVSIHPFKIPPLTHCLWEYKIVQVLWKAEYYAKLDTEVIISFSSRFLKLKYILPGLLICIHGSKFLDSANHK